MNSTANWSLLKKIKYSVVAILFLLILIEICFRIYFLLYLKPFGTNIKIQGSALQVADTNLVFKNTPFYIDFNKNYQHNEYGFKCKLGEIKIPHKTKNTFVVLLLGASSMEGMGSNKTGEWYDITGVSDHSAKNSIAAYLQNYLQKHIPTKKVVVYNGATSSYILWQSMQKYLVFKEVLKPDFVISLDGNNEFAILDKNFNKKKLVENEFYNYPIFQSPTKYIISITQQSYFFNSLKKFLFDFKLKSRTAKNQNNNYPIKRKWLLAKEKKLNFAPIDSAIQRAIYNYSAEIKTFDSILNKNNTPYLLAYQPYLFFKSRALQSETERALYNYFTYYNNDAINNTYKLNVIKQLAVFEKSNKNFKLFNPDSIPVNNLFLDYCHFTTDGNKWFAKYFGEIILKKINPQKGNY